MQFDGIQMTLIVLFLVSAVAVVVVCNFVRETFFHAHRPVMAYGGPEPAWEFAKHTAVPVAVEVVTSESFVCAPEPERAPLIASQPQVASTTPSPLPERAADAALWEGVTPPQPVQPTFQVIQGGSGGEMIDQAELQRFIEDHERFSGVVVSISVNDSDGSLWHSPGLMPSVSREVASILGAHDIGCRTAFDEFLIVSSAQEPARRRNEITARLWDCQLRGARVRSVRLTWGTALVGNESLAEAVASATESMRRNRRVSDSIATVSNNLRRRAV